MKYKYRGILILAAAILLAIWVAPIQAQDNSDFGYWNDIQVSTAVNKQVDAVGGVRFNTKRNGSIFAEQRIYAGLNLKSKNGRFVVAPWVVYLKNFARTPFTEIRPQVTVGYRFNVGKTNITPRVRVEYHAKQRLKDDGRIVPILHIDRKLTKKYGVFQTTEFWIPVYNERDTTKYRQRYFFGVNRVLNKKLSVDVFYLYQRDEQVAPKHNHAVGAAWKVRL